MNLPTLATTRAVIQAGHTDRRSTKNFDAVVLELAARLSKFIRLDTYKRRKTEATLKSAGILMTPETFMAKAIIKAGMPALGIIPAFFIFPILCPVLIFLAIAIFFKEIMSADEALKKKRNEIEYELPRFVSTVAQQLRASRDVLSILEKVPEKRQGLICASNLNYYADMQSGNT